MWVLGLTGGIASGKSTVSQMLRDLGAPLVDADQAARQVVQRGQPALAELVALFGRAILLPDGNLDRKALASRIFADPAARERVNALLHPRIDALCWHELRRLAAARRYPVAVFDVPLLFEVGLDKRVDRVWVVVAGREQQLARLMARDGLSREEAEARLSAQMPLADKAARADVVIDNSGTPAATREQVAIAWQELCREAGSQPPPRSGL